MNGSRRVIVVGSGAAGMAAAAAAAASGARVTVLEAATHLGGTTAYSGGGIWIPGNHCAEALGIEDSPEAGLEYLQHICLGDFDLNLSKAYVTRGPRVVQETEAHSALRWEIIDGYGDYYAERPGGTLGGRSLAITPVQVGTELMGRVRKNPYGGRPLTINERELGFDPHEVSRREAEGIVTGGNGLIGAMYQACLDVGVEFRTGVRVRRLLARGDAISGVDIEGEPLPGQVILATGGFERDPALVNKFLRAPMTAPAGPPTNRGDGLRMGMQVGAELGNMSEAWWAPALGIPGETFDGAPLYHMMFTEFAKPGTIVVDQRGRRFANEATNKNDFGRAMHSFDATTSGYPAIPAWALFDAERRASHRIGPAQPDDPDPSWLVKADTWDELAGLIAVPARALLETIERFNTYGDTGVDTEFGRASLSANTRTAGTDDAREQLRPLTQAPFYAIKVQSGCLGTKGGLKFNDHAQVQREDNGGTIEGLYAAGNASANPFGLAYPSGGGTIGPAIVFGWIAGETAAAAAT